MPQKFWWAETPHSHLTVDNVSLTIHSGEPYGFVWEFIYGKFTMGRIITRFLPTSGGQI